MASKEIDIELVWVGKGLLTSYKLPVYFTSDGELLVWLNDYMLDFAKPKRQSKETTKNTFDARARDLKAFATYLYKYKIDWKNFNRENFQEFIEKEVIKVKAWQANQQYEQIDESGANLNVNRKIHSIYDFYEWAQSEKMVSNVIGPGCQIDTLLSTDKDSKGILNHKSSRTQPNKLSKKVISVLYRPLTLPVPISRKTIKHFPTDKELNLLNIIITQGTESLFIAERDSLFIAILRETALRAESANSLTTLQIPPLAELEQETDTGKEFPVRPFMQKLGYQNTFMLSYPLCLEIRKFIDGPRADLLTTLGINDSLVDDAIFLNSKTGKAMTAKSMREIIRNGFRKAGITVRRTGAPAIRRARANQEGVDTIRRTRESGGMVTKDSVQMAIARKLGHSSMASQDAYIYALNAVEAETDEAEIAKRRTELELRENRIALKEAELALREKRLQMPKKRDIGLDRNNMGEDESGSF